MSVQSIKELGRKIRLRRKTLKITQPDLAQLAGISVNTLYKIERGVANPTLKIIDKLLDVLGLELSLAIKSIDYTD